jgi:hypothetical protein
MGIFKSVNGGVTWTKIAAHSSVGTSVTRIATAPDDIDVVAYIADNNEVIASTNGGNTWSALGIPQETGIAGGAAATLAEIAISPTVSSVNYVAVGGEEAANVGNMWYFNLGSAVPKWMEGNTQAGWDATSDEGVFGLAFSPAFASDKVLVAITGPSGAVAGDTLVKQQMFSLSSSNLKWNASAAFPAAVTVDTLAAASTITRADVALPDTYLGGDPDTRKAFVAVSSDDATNKGGLFRVSTTSKVLKDVTNVWSVSYNTDADKLVAGAGSTAAVYRSADPMASTVHVYTSSTYKYVGGTMGVTAQWMGDKVAAAGQGNESAFGTSTDDGKTFNDISLINTLLTNLTDVVPNADGSSFYVISDDTADTSVWLKEGGSWQRVLTVIGNIGFIARLAPEDSSVIYLADVGGTDLYFSESGGKSKWLYRVGPAAIVDFAAESSQVAYTLSGANVYKSTNAGFIWGSAKSTKLTAGVMIKSLSEGNLIVGGNAGDVSYSTDSGSNWTKIGPTVVGAGNIQATADGLEDGNNIYAATSTVGQRVQRWTIGSNTTSWTSISNTGGTLFTQDLDGDTVADNCGATGIELVDGALYVMAQDGANDSMVCRNLSPHGTYTTVQVTWSTTASPGELFNVGPQAMDISTGSSKIWTIDSVPAADTVDVFTDTLSEAGPTLSSPADNFSVKMNRTTGRAYGVTFTWPRLSKSTVYDLQVAFDSGFKEILISENNWATTSSTVSTTIGPFSAAPVSGATPNWEPGTTYYWRCRADGPLRSPYSETRSFTVEELVLFQATLQAPNPGAQDVLLQPAFAWSAVEGATQYQFQMADNDDYLGPTALKKTLYSNVWQSEVKLNYSTTYFWRVKAQTLEGKTVVAESPWVTNIFTTMAEPAPEAPPVVVKEQPAPPAPQITLPPPVVNIPPAPEPITPAYVWAIIGIGAVLVIVVIVLIVRTRRPV